MRAATSVSQASGSTPLSLAVRIRVKNAAARTPPESRRSPARIESFPGNPPEHPDCTNRSRSDALDDIAELPAGGVLPNLG